MHTSSNKERSDPCTIRHSQCERSHQPSDADHGPEASDGERDMVYAAAAEPLPGSCGAGRLVTISIDQDSPSPTERSNIMSGHGSINLIQSDRVSICATINTGMNDPFRNGKFSQYMHALYSYDMLQD